MEYGEKAQTLLSGLIKMSHSPDPEMREPGYQAASYDRPDREVFLPLAHRALQDDYGPIRAVANQLMWKRFPEQAKRAGLDNPFYAPPAKRPPAETAPSGSP